MKKGKLITFEGIEGSGKTTQLTLLSTKLKREGVKVVETKEPGGTKLGAKIRELLLEGDLSEIDPKAELLLFLADRREHLRSVILPALSQGAIVLSDRFIDSTIAYQGYGRGLALELVTKALILFDEDITPDLTLLFDLLPETSLARVSSEATKSFEKEPLAFHKRVREGYLELAKRYPERIKIIPGDLPVEEVAKRVEKEVRKIL